MVIHLMKTGHVLPVKKRQYVTNELIRSLRSLSADGGDAKI